MPDGRTEIIPYLFYKDVPAALDWLGRAFGFVEEMRIGTPAGGMHAQTRLDGQRIMLGQSSGPAHSPHGSPGVGGAATMGVFVYLDDVDAHHARAVAAGAIVELPPHDVDYGRTYAARDLEGHPWYFTRRSS